MTANLQPNDAFDQTTATDQPNDELDQTTTDQPNDALDQTTATDQPDTIQNDNPQATQETQATLKAETAVLESEPEATADDATDNVTTNDDQAVDAVDSAAEEPVATAVDASTADEPQAGAAEADTTPKATGQPPVPPDLDTTAQSELELTAERPALSEEDQVYYGFAVSGDAENKDAYASPLWERVDPLKIPSDRPKPSRLRTAAVVCGVAVVSFLAGGLTSRMSSQVPMLFGQNNQPVESVASYTPRTTQDEADDAEKNAPERNTAQTDATAPKGTTTDKDSTDTSKDNDKDKSDKSTGTTTDKTPTSKDKDSGDSSSKNDSSSTNKNTNRDTSSDSPYNTWYFNDNGDESISYNRDEDTVTIDYDGYSLTAPTEDLFGSEDLLEQWYQPRGNSDGYGSSNDYGDYGDPYGYDYYYYDYGYGDDYGTGYDTEEDRDRRNWGGSNSGSGRSTSYDWGGWDSYTGYRA